MLAQKMYLQLFAEGDGAEGAQAQESVADSSNGSGSEEAPKNSFDDFLKNPDNQAEFDRLAANITLINFESTI